MSVIALLGDSFFDNASYIGQNEKSVLEQLQDSLSSGSSVNLMAIDGSVTEEVVRQIESIPSATTHLVISSGGNDALRSRDSLLMAHSTEALLNMLATVQEDFGIIYMRLLTAAKKTQLPTVVCTIYDAIPGLSREEKTLLSIFNDVILTQVSRAGFPVIDLRSLCIDAKDFSEISPIEPSVQGGMKIARRIAEIVTHFDFRSKRTVIY
jgi:hypothetical protein